MTKLSDTQLVVLSAACQRADRNVLPLPATLKGGAAAKVIGGLTARGFVQEVDAQPGDRVWRQAEDGRRTTLVATGAATDALGIEPDDDTTSSGAGKARDKAAAGVAARASATAKPGKVRRKAPRAAQAATQANGAGEAAMEPAAPDGVPVAKRKGSRTGTKQENLIAMLRRPEGASIDEIIAATGWQPHTVRGAISGALKKKLGLAVASDKVEGRGRVYRLPQ